MKCKRLKELAKKISSHAAIILPLGSVPVEGRKHAKTIYTPPENNGPEPVWAVPEQLVLSTLLDNVKTALNIPVVSWLFSLVETVIFQVVDNTKHH
jgi:hypothetical protein